MITAEAVTRAALVREESRGAHTRVDFPTERDEWLQYNVVVRRGTGGRMDVRKEKRPDPNMPGGLQLGFYKIRVSKKVNGKEMVPEKYNTATTLGHQVAMDDADLARSQKMALNLTSK